MATIQTDKRRQELCFTTPGEVPTIPSPPNLQWGDPGFNSTDIMPGEFAINLPDKKVFFRSGNTIVSVVNNEQLTAALNAVLASIPSGSDDLTNDSASVSGATITDALDYLRAMTLNDIVSNNSFFYNDIISDGIASIYGLPDAIKPEQAVPFRQLQEYVSETNVYDLQGGIDLSTSPNFPAAKKGMRWEVTAAGKPNGAPDSWLLEPWDEIVCKTNSPTPGDYASVGANFYYNKAAISQASESYSGTAAIASTPDAEAGTDNTKIMTPLRVAQKIAYWLTNTLPNAAITWAAKQIFSLAPRFNSVNASAYLKTDASKDLTSVSSIPAADITESSTKKFVPQPTADNDFLVGQASGNTWIKKTLAEAKTILGITKPPASCVLTTADQTGINNGASFIDITDLNFSADANSMYFIHWAILVTTSASNGFRVALKTPSGASMEVARSWYGTNASDIMTSDDFMGASQFTNIGAYWVRLEGYIKTGATAGTVSGRIITNNIANVLTVRAGSGGLVIKK